MPTPGERNDPELPAPNPPGSPVQVPMTAHGGYPDLTPLLDCARSMGECACKMVAPLESIPAIASAIEGLAANVQEQTAVLVKVAQGLGVATDVTVPTAAKWDPKELEAAILAIDQPCTDPAEQIGLFRGAFQLAAAARPATTAEREVALALAEQLGTRVDRHLVLADRASRPDSPGGC